MLPSAKLKYLQLSLALKKAHLQGEATPSVPIIKKKRISKIRTLLLIENVYKANTKWH